MFKQKSKLPAKGKLSQQYNVQSSIESIRDKAAAFAKENPQLQGGKAEFNTKATVKDPSQAHRAEMRQDRVRGFTFTVGK